MRFLLVLLAACFLFSCNSDETTNRQIGQPDLAKVTRRNVIDSLRPAIDSIVRDRKAAIGIGIMDLQTGDTLLVAGDERFALMSVAKFPQVLALLAMADSGKYDVHAPVTFAGDDFKVSTGSSLRKDHPQKTFDLPLAEVFRYAIGQSDNITSNKIFRLEGGPAAVEAYVRSLGITDMGFGTDYTFPDTNSYRRNWGTPRATLQLMEKFHKGRILSDSNKSLLWTAMLEATSGANRLKAGLPASTPLAHKTGSSGTNPKTGITAATNDIGYVQTPDGKWVAIVVYVTESKEPAAENEAIIAAVAKAVWAYFTSRP